MATEQELITALRKADAAGDTAAAQAIARRIASMRTSQPSASGVTSPNASRLTGYTPGRDPEIARMSNPTGSGVENFFAGMGQQQYETARGVGQLLGAVTPEQIEESRKLDAPLGKTTSGQLGQITGAALQFIGPAAVAKAAGAPAQVMRFFAPTTAPGAAAQGAAFGAVQPALSSDERIANAALGGAGGYAGARIGQGIANMAKPNAPTVPTQRAAVIDEARAAGYVLPPSEMGAGMATRALEGLSGKIQIGQAASTRNQSVTNNLAKRALGIPEDAPLTVEALEAVRAQAGQAYDAIGSIGTVRPNLTYFRTLNNLTKEARQALKDFPEAQRSPIIDAVESLKVPQFDARSALAQIKSLRDQASSLPPERRSLAGAYRKAANALERAMEDHANKIGKPDLAKNFRSARELIAKTYTVQEALNTATGDVSAKVFGKLKAKGKPLSGDLKTIGSVAEAFPKATQALDTPYRAFSPLDLAAGGFGAGSANPLLLAAVAGRPGVRGALLSGPMQELLKRQALTGRSFTSGPILPNSPAWQRVLDEQRRALTGAGAGLLGD